MTTGEREGLHKPGARASRGDQRGLELPGTGVTSRTLDSVSCVPGRRTRSGDARRLPRYPSIGGPAVGRSTGRAERRAAASFAVLRAAAIAASALAASNDHPPSTVAQFGAPDLPQSLHLIFALLRASGMASRRARGCVGVDWVAQSVRPRQVSACATVGRAGSGNLGHYRRPQACPTAANHGARRMVARGEVDISVGQGESDC